MTNSEMIEKIVSKSGITPQQAEEALRLNNWDLLDAMIYVERTYGQHNNANSSYYTTFNAGNAGADFNQGFDGINEQKYGVDGNSFSDVIRKLFRKSVRNGIAIVNNGRDVVTIPLLLWIIFILSSFSSVLLLMLVSMFFNVNYRFKGSDLEGSKLNNVFNIVYDFVQNLKKSILG